MAAPPQPAPLDVAREVAYEMKVFLHGAKMAPPVAPGWLAQIEKWHARLSAGPAPTSEEPKHQAWCNRPDEHRYPEQCEGDQ